MLEWLMFNIIIKHVNMANNWQTDVQYKITNLQWMHLKPTKLEYQPLILCHSVEPKIVLSAC
jgi:hypothetical protein